MVICHSFWLPGMWMLLRLRSTFTIQGQLLALSASLASRLQAPAPQLQVRRNFSQGWWQKDWVPLAAAAAGMEVPVVIQCPGWGGLPSHFPAVGAASSNSCSGAMCRGLPVHRTSKCFSNSPGNLMSCPIALNEPKLVFTACTTGYDCYPTSERWVWNEIIQGKHRDDT